MASYYNDHKKGNEVVKKSARAPIGSIPGFISTREYLHKLHMFMKRYFVSKFLNMLYDESISKFEVTLMKNLCTDMLLLQGWSHILYSTKF